MTSDADFGELFEAEDESKYIINHPLLCEAFVKDHDLLQVNQGDFSVALSKGSAAGAGASNVIKQPVGDISTRASGGLDLDAKLDEAL